MIEQAVQDEDDDGGDMSSFISSSGRSSNSRTRKSPKLANSSSS